MLSNAVYSELLFQCIVVGVCRNSKARSADLSRPMSSSCRGLGLGDHCVNCDTPGYSTTDQLWQWFLFFTILWACYAFVEHQTMLLLLFCKSSFTAGIASFYCTVSYILVGSSTLK